MISVGHGAMRQSNDANMPNRPKVKNTKSSRIEAKLNVSISKNSGCSGATYNDAGNAAPGTLPKIIISASASASASAS